MDKMDELFKKYMNGLLSPDEQEELAGLIKHLSDEQLSDYLKRYWDTNQLNDQILSEQTVEAIYQRIVRREAPVKKVIPLVRRRWLQIAASLIFIFLTGTMVYLYRSTEPESSPEFGALHKKDLEPGGNRAILKLADGTEVDLDKSANGVIASQANVSVVKLDNGQLQYQPSDQKSDVVQYNTVETPRGGQYRLILPDSSVVLLNSESSICFPVAFNSHERKVEVSGEVYFEVSEDKARPFIVYHGGMRVQVYGTHFIVLAYPDEALAKTTLLEGSVKVSHGADNMMLKSGQQAVLDARGNLKMNPEVSITKESAWVNGIFLFDHSGIQEIMTQISRWYNVDVEYRGTVTKRTFSGIVNRNSKVSQVLQIMERAGIRFEIEGDKIIVTK